MGDEVGLLSSRRMMASRLVTGAFLDRHHRDASLALGMTNVGACCDLSGIEAKPRYVIPRRSRGIPYV